MESLINNSLVFAESVSTSGGLSSGSSLSINSLQEGQRGWPQLVNCNHLLCQAAGAQEVCDRGFGNLESLLRSARELHFLACLIMVINSFF